MTEEEEKKFTESDCLIYLVDVLKMGGGASAEHKYTLDRKEDYVDIVALYESELRPKLEAKMITDDDAFLVIKEKYELKLKEKIDASINSSNNNNVMGKLLATNDELINPNISKSGFTIGDVVKVKDNGFMVEGVITDKHGENCLVVDLGDDLIEVPVSDCILVLSAIDFEVGDTVEMKPEGMSIYFMGVVSSVNNIDKTCDIMLESEDDSGDIEYNVPYENIRKRMSSRPLASARWNKVITAIKALKAFSRINHIQNLSHHTSH